MRLIHVQMVDGNNAEHVDAGAELEHLGGNGCWGQLVQEFDDRFALNVGVGARSGGEVIAELLVERVGLLQEKAERCGPDGLSEPLPQETRGVKSDPLRRFQHAPCRSFLHRMPLIEHAVDRRDANAGGDCQILYGRRRPMPAPGDVSSQTCDIVLMYYERLFHPLHWPGSVICYGSCACFDSAAALGVPH
jgi:hypothetical protein